MRMMSTTSVEAYETALIKDNIYKVKLRTNIEQKINGYFYYNEYSLITELDDISVLDDIDTFNKYLEAAQLEEEAKNKEKKIKNLKQNLENTDYQVIKSLENYSLGLTLPYDYSALITKRQEIRDNINNLESETDEIDELSQIQQRKINEMCSICQTTITNGIDYNDEHYRLNTTDQINLTSLYALAQVGQSVPYHADSQVCRIYTPEEMIGLVQTATSWITYHTTYYNLLKNQILAMDNIDEIKSVVYGMELKEEYQSIINLIVNSNAQ
jgi:hypothetical protein